MNIYLVKDTHSSTLITAWSSDDALERVGVTEAEGATCRKMSGNDAEELAHD